VGNRTTFWLIWVVALVPILAAAVMYFGQIGVPDGRTHHGELVESGTQYFDIGLPSPGDPAKWQVVLASTARCVSCRVFSDGLENFHTALGRERDRLVVREVEATGLTVSDPSIWVVDPLGNVVLRFKPEINPTLILQDLKKLLKVSKVG
jgi:hypothetical protein